MRLSSLVILFGLFFIHSHSQGAIQHTAEVSLVPQEHKITVTDRVTLPQSSAHFSAAACKAEYLFRIHSGLNPKIISPNTLMNEVQLTLLGTQMIDPLHKLSVERYLITVPCGLKELEFQYSGEIYHALTEPENPYSRGTADTPGMISADGVVLSASTYWYPQWEISSLQNSQNIQDFYVTFDLQIHLPKDWSAVSQGTRVGENRWEEHHPQDDFYLIAAQFTEYSRSSSLTPHTNIQMQAFLRSPDEAMATRYLDATKKYLDLYSRLIGPYPYSKFALVENFWDTGFGMPSFTLLGSNIIRLPFIISTSYPHEILHNWWGNSVYVDYARGNWCEGLTAYLADHLMAEQAGLGDAYRRDTLQKYTDFVNSENDFPLIRFIGRTDAPTEAVGYGKSSMVFHMFRRELGDELFKKFLNDFYLQNRFKAVSFSEIKASFENVSGEKVSGRKFNSAFSQWVEKTGAPELKILSATSSVAKGNGAFLFTAVIEQTQLGETFELNVPVAIHLQGQSQAVQKIYPMQGRTLKIHETFGSRPVWFEVDPEFDVFRRLSRDEVPPVITMALGAPKALMLLPSKAGLEALQGWKNFAALVQSALPEGPDSFWVMLDSDVKELPQDRAIWVLGAQNLFVEKFSSQLKDQPFVRGTDFVEVGGKKVSYENHGLFLVSRSVENPEQIWTWVAADPLDALPTLAGKITHYGKYSYLGFEGSKMTNMLKGVWKLNASSMSIGVKQTDGMPVSSSMKAKLAPRQSLADEELVF